MKRLLILVVMLVMLVCGSAFAQESFNAQGSVLVPNLQVWFMSSDSWMVPGMSLTNISSVPVQCRVTYYDHDGNELTYLEETYTGGSNFVRVATGRDFDIPAKSTRFNTLRRPSSRMVAYAYAVVEWKSTADPLLRKALVGGGEQQRLHRTSSGMALTQPRFLINDGEPF
ncbi:hypothetical protein [Maridesulfovibrio salexigens]|uniref:Uncharacterized protein n=1 Tax=Maridesulfovibrio salexigens (strain ATCC 14822 / DSM 2638 / NCIMB 8403 / VKM B-1763) TaxID=526222 RepID=C6C0N9_MARSD|nr:hypothetical protein [Maridesulfovibrio salexigens]ACS80986.1 hypothetical protein Desal_2934 [Maridesulfovibrio salexigens DSM 2638]